MDWLIFIGLVFIAAISGAAFKPGAWYEGLRKPAWTPPNGLFPVVWTVLYALIAWAGVLVWRAGPDWIALGFWAAQWVFNAGWSWLFFGRRRMDLGMIDIGLLWVSIAGFMISAWPVNPLASLLFLPYLAWVSAAGLLNYSVWRLNASSDARGTGLEPDRPGSR